MDNIFKLLSCEVIQIFCRLKKQKVYIVLNFVWQNNDILILQFFYSQIK